MGWSPVDSHCPGWDAVWIVQDRGGGSEKTGAAQQKERPFRASQKDQIATCHENNGHLYSALALQHSLQNGQDN